MEIWIRYERFGVWISLRMGQLCNYTTPNQKSMGRMENANKKKKEEVI